MRLSNELREFLESLNSRGIDALIRNKRAIGRPQDIADLATLES